MLGKIIWPWCYLHSSYRNYCCLKAVGRAGIWDEADFFQTPRAGKLLTKSNDPFCGSGYEQVGLRAGGRGVQYIINRIGKVWSKWNIQEPKQKQNKQPWRLQWITPAATAHPGCRSPGSQKQPLQSCQGAAVSCVPDQGIWKEQSKHP